MDRAIKQVRAYLGFHARIYRERDDRYHAQVMGLLDELDVERGEHLVNHLIVSREHCATERVDRRHDELSERSLKRLLVGVIGLVSPDLLCWVEEVVTPELLHHLVLVDAELLGIGDGEELEREAPTVFA